MTEVPGTSAPPIVAPAGTESGRGGRSAEHWLLLSFALAGLLLLVAFALWIEPDPRGFGTHEKLGLPSCKMLEWTGYPCPGCGVTTSVDLVARGHFWASIKNQPLGFLVGIGIPIVALWAIVGHLRGRDLFRDVSAMRFGRIGIGLAAFAAASWLYKIARVRGWIG